MPRTGGKWSVDQGWEHANGLRGLTHTLVSREAGLLVRRRASGGADGGADCGTEALDEEPRLLRVTAELGPPPGRK
jgi:hypothetical protein